MRAQGLVPQAASYRPPAQSPSQQSSTPLHISTMQQVRPAPPTPSQASQQQHMSPAALAQAQQQQQRRMLEQSQMQLHQARLQQQQQQLLQQQMTARPQVQVAARPAGTPQQHYTLTPGVAQGQVADSSPKSNVMDASLKERILQQQLQLRLHTERAMAGLAALPNASNGNASSLSGTPGSSTGASSLPAAKGNTGAPGP